MSGPFTVTPIGHVRTAYTDRDATPVQPALNPDDNGQVVLDAAARDGLADLDGFDYAWLLTWLRSQTEEPAPSAMRQVPFLLSSRPREIGLFAMRGPRRPNPVGLHLVRIVAVYDDGFTFAGVDMVDRTPLLDVKPWVATFDLPHGHTLRGGGVRCGWFDDVDLSWPHTPATLRAEREQTGEG
jgi:tRNA-Thr(GGU) m(6)t(6)A37 methyltransferase TsaA